GTGDGETGGNGDREIGVMFPRLPFSAFALSFLRTVKGKRGTDWRDAASRVSPSPFHPVIFLRRVKRSPRLPISLSPSLLIRDGQRRLLQNPGRQARCQAGRDQEGLSTAGAKVPS